MAAASGSEPAVLTSEKQAVLNEGIGLIFSRWTAMRAAVENGWGGGNSRGKAERTVSTVFEFFIQSKAPMYFDELDYILARGLDELNTVADDGSLEEVTEKLLALYEECREGNYQTVEKLRLTNPQTSASVIKVSNGNNEEDEESESDDESDEDTNDQSTDMMVDDASEQKPTADDGWTVVPSRKNKGKRN